MEELGGTATRKQGNRGGEQNRAEALSTGYWVCVLGIVYCVSCLCIVAIPPREMNALGSGRQGRLPRCVSSLREAVRKTCIRRDALVER